jgi:hypothetical protein
VTADSINSSPKVALLVAFLERCCFGIFSPAFNIAVNDPFDLAKGTPLSVPVANIWLSLAFTVVTFIGSI